MSEEIEGNQTYNTSYLSDSFTMMRIDSEKLLAELEAFYRGTRIIGWSENDNQLKPVFDKFGKPRMNQKGLQDMMSWLRSLFNPQTVQGNTNDIDLSNQLAIINEDIAVNLMVNLHEYEISENDYEGIIDRTMATATFFFSRTLNNLERESYAQTTKSLERVGGNSGFSLNPFNSGGRT